MFKFLKEKLKKAISKFSKEVDEELEVPDEPPIEEEEPAPPDRPQLHVPEPEMPEPSATEVLVEESPDVLVEPLEKQNQPEVFTPLDKKGEELSPEETPVAKVKPELRPLAKTQKAKQKEAESGSDVAKKVEEAERKAEQAQRARAEKERLKQEIAADMIRRAQEVSEKEAAQAKLIRSEPKVHAASRPKVPSRKPSVKKPAKTPAPAPAKAEPSKAAPAPEMPVKKEPSVPVPQAPVKRGFLDRLKKALGTKKLSKARFDELFWGLEVVLLENNVAVEVIEKIKQDMEKALVNQPIPRGRVLETITDALRKSIVDLFDVGGLDVLEAIKSKGEKPYVICFVGINGSGKTTTIAKFAKMIDEAGHSVVLAAGDTFRAAAIDQLEHHAKALGVKMIKHSYGSDPAAVAFDAIKHAKATGKEVVLIDTAGRLHSNINLMDELRKVIRVAKPDLKIFVGEAITGNDCVEQAQKFNEAVQLDGIILSKADIDEKGGASISVSFVTGKPVIYLGVGQEYGDLRKFDSGAVVKSLGL